MVKKKNEAYLAKNKKNKEITVYVNTPTASRTRQDYICSSLITYFNQSGPS